MDIIENFENVKDGDNNDHNGEHILCFEHWLCITCRSLFFFIFFYFFKVLPHTLQLTMENDYLPSSW